MDYFELMHRRLEGQEPFVPGYLGSKEKVRELAGLMGIRVPRIYYRGTLDGLALDGLPEQFALKPTFASTSIGVHLISTDPEGRRINAVDGQPVVWAEVIERLREVSARYEDHPAKDVFIVEELLVDHDGQFPPPDVRAYTFFGEIGMVQIDHHLRNTYAESMYFDGNFQPFDDVSERYGVAEQAAHWQFLIEAKRSPNWQAVLRIARRVSLAVPCAFCRVDMYDTPKGVYLGEITFYPGTFYYRNSKLMYDKEAQRLGELWESAAKRLVEAQVYDSRAGQTQKG